MKPSKNCIAICTQGRVGLILCEKPTEYRNHNGKVTKTWWGTTIAPSEQVGMPWSSSRPRVIAALDDDGKYTPAG